jgi:hypothetical protein
MPGSTEKIRVMTKRAARQEELFHPCDASDLPRGGLRAHKKGTKRHCGCETIEDAAMLARKGERS